MFHVEQISIRIPYRVSQNSSKDRDARNEQSPFRGRFYRNIYETDYPAFNPQDYKAENKEAGLSNINYLLFHVEQISYSRFYFRASY